MSQPQTSQQAAVEFSLKIVEAWSAGLKELIEQKHLYQKVDVAIDLLEATTKANTAANHQIWLDQFIDLWRQRRLKAVMSIAPETSPVGGQSVQVTPPVLHVTNVKLFCVECKSSEVFSPLWARDVAEECIGPHQKLMPRREDHQLFFIAFQCQRCKDDPQGFIVRRSRNRLFLEGRSPIEHVAVVKYFPKKESSFFSDALVAHNAGKKLAGLFYLRTFLEQFAKRLTGLDGRVTGEVLMDTYMATLPQQHRDYMPSFRSLYEKLSEAIHSAREDDQLFQSTKEEIDRHFDIRRLFRIPETELKPDPSETKEIQSETQEDS